jgi:hypothetical protein
MVGLRILSIEVSKVVEQLSSDLCAEPLPRIILREFVTPRILLMPKRS